MYNGKAIEKYSSTEVYIKLQRSKYAYQFLLGNLVHVVIQVFILCKMYMQETRNYGIKVVSDKIFIK